MILFDAFTAFEMACGVGTFFVVLCCYIVDVMCEVMMLLLIDFVMECLYVSVDLLDVFVVVLYMVVMLFVSSFRVGTFYRGSTTTFVFL